MAVVTVSRLYGAGGLRVARAIADALGFTLVDRELVEQAAARLGIDPAVASSRDEQVPALIEHRPGQFAACHFAGDPVPADTMREASPAV